MKTKSEIEMDFNRALLQADELVLVSKKLIEIEEKNSMALTRLSAFWIGSNAGKFKEKSGMLEREILSAADDLKRIADSVKKTAGFVYNAEKTAVTLGL